MKEEVILIILTCLELAEEHYLRLIPQTSVTCVLNFHLTSPSLLAAKDTVIETILKMIMHGIASPAFPSSTWCKAHFWLIKELLVLQIYEMESVEEEKNWRNGCLFRRGIESTEWWSESHFVHEQFPD
ncbi:putative DNA helicase [Helianthus debilis subsp. tardiflorus]